VCHYLIASLLYLLERQTRQSRAWGSVGTGTTNLGVGGCVLLFVLWLCYAKQSRKFISAKK
jgi:hypothetical protein